MTKPMMQRTNVLEVLLFTHYGDDSDVLIVLPTVPADDQDLDLCQTVSFKTGTEIGQNPISLQTLMQPYAGEDKQAALRFIEKLYQAKVRHVPALLPRHHKVRRNAMHILSLFAQMQMEQRAIEQAAIAFKNRADKVKKLSEDVSEAQTNEPESNETRA